MGDSDDDYQSHNNSGNLGHNGNNASSGGGGSGIGNNYNSNNKKNNRDKFYRERDDSNNGGYGNSRRDWNNGDRNNRGYDSYKNSRGSNHQYNYGNSNQNMVNNSYGMRGNSDYPKKYSQHSPTSGHHGDASPPPYKRNRRNDYEDRNDDYSSPQNNYRNQNNDSDCQTQPPFLSFKLFLQQQDDNISDEEAIRKYNDYKMDFKKTQINNFFLEHKEEDWFKLRYHPDENYKRRNEQNQFVLNRLEVFLNLHTKGMFDNLSVECDNSKDLIKALDAAVIKLEGGNDQDLENEKSENTDTLDNKEENSEESEKEAKESEKEVKENDGEITEENNGDKDTQSKKRKSGEDSGSESGAYSESEENDDTNEKRKKKSKKNKDLHKTCSIFMRNLAPSVGKQDLENLCKEYEGFKRVAISDPAPERGFFRRGWITFESHVDVKKICWNLQNTKIKDFNPGAIVNRELTNRIRPTTNIITHHKSIVKNDIKLAMKIIQNMDKRWNLWCDENSNQTDCSNEDDEIDEEEDETVKLEKTAFSQIKVKEPKYLKNEFTGSNPLFKNITDYIVDEVDAEEQELLGDATNTTSNTSGSFNLEIDKNYNSMLDKLVLYLRIVHSFDFYNSIEYQQEDSMPNRCGIMFARPPLTAVNNIKITTEEVNNYNKQFDSKMKAYVEYKEKLDEATASKLGVKTRKDEVEKFIKTNTQELSTDRWLCPLSGKKFKGPEFIRKHLFYKHMDKIIEVKKEVEYFNNYVYDPKRPLLPEHQSNKSGNQQQNVMGNSNMSNYSNNAYMQSSPVMMQSNMMGQMGNYSNMHNRQMQQGYGMHSGNFDQMQYGANFQNFNQQGFHMNRSRYPMNRNGRGGKDSREMIQYRDLDAPEEN